MISERETKEYIIKIANKDLRAQEEFFTDTYRCFYQAAVSIVKSHEDAEDVVSAFFQDIYRISLKCVHVNNCRAYLFTVIKNIARNFIAREKKFKKVDIDNAEKLIACDNKIFKSDTVNLLDSVLNESEKQSILLVIYYEYTYREAAKIMGTSLGSLQRILKEALKKLRKSLISK